MATDRKVSTEPPPGEAQAFAVIKHVVIGEVTSRVGSQHSMVEAALQLIAYDIGKSEVKRAGLIEQTYEFTFKGLTISVGVSTEDG